jgi:hypothetical protein
MNYIFISNKNGHHKNYGIVIKKIIKGKTILNKYKIPFILIKKNKIFYLDFDKSQLFYGLLAPLRKLLGINDIYFSVRSEYILNRNFIGLIKRFIHTLVKISGGRIISIHKGINTSDLSPYISDFIYDIQYWDLPFLDASYTKPPELNFLSNNSSILAVIGALNQKRCKDKLIQFLTENNPKFHTIFAGKINQEDQSRISKLSNVTLINRYISDNELFYLYKIAHAIYCYYDLSVRRPSGIFGRAVQFGKPAIIRKNGFLAKTYKQYDGIFEIENILELNKVMRKISCHKIYDYPNYDDSQTLIKLLQ